MIDSDGHVRITDFGLAAVVGAIDDVRAGTPAYMAPEQLAGKEVTQRSDIYAPGLVLFELFTGKRVFEAKTLTELLALHESGALTPPPLMCVISSRRSNARSCDASSAILLCAGFILRSRVFTELSVVYERLGLILSLSLYNTANIWLFYIALEPYVRRFWPQLLIGWTRLISGRTRDPLVGREVLVGVAAGTVGAFLIESRQLVPHLFGLRPVMTDLTGILILLGPRHVIAVALQTVRRALGIAIQIVGIVVLLKILVRRTWLVLLLSAVVVLPIAMNGTFAGEELALELTISTLGIALGLAVLLRFGLLALVVMFYAVLLIEAFPLSANFSRPYAGISLGLIATIAALSVFGFVASRGDEPLFRPRNSRLSRSHLCRCSA